MLILNIRVTDHKLSKSMSELNDAENTNSSTDSILKRFLAPANVLNIRLNPYAKPFSMYTPLPEKIKSATLSQDALYMGVPSTTNRECLNNNTKLNTEAKCFMSPPINSTASDVRTLMNNVTSNLNNRDTPNFILNENEGDNYYDNNNVYSIINKL